MTEAEEQLIEAALAWRRIHGPATHLTSSAMMEVAAWAQQVIRERNERNADAAQNAKTSTSNG